ncbi:structural maintenance of chromosomes protein 5 isoform X1 [Cinnamomum micranthum f. kanehirae]|uniref:Structural maintenance of chromosomes protein 5 n=1 Tax=Cinnamomum micranthum f. kanehirae TaxID=337451 RepID=A0A443NDY2_9MAGN|nr:structural maintenance of chromosomes protein 5 isoform X1 [Cinnamomum micranthum f. kanehirae]
MAERAAKRPKLEKRGDDGYLPGNIVEIEIHNFMTYDHLKCKPGARLNLVIGPNGSGKSSLVCAIALGLAGEPQLLGRATSIGAYVKRGEESGFIKISLRGDTTDEQICITRKINTQNRSEWLVNGKTVAKRDVVEVIQRFNIQVNNLTQFLPQDRVCEFAKLTPIQLLEETEKAVGNAELPVQHSALIDKSRELKKLEVAVKQNGDTLNQLKALNAEQEKDVERLRQREQLLAKVDSMKKKLPWLKYDMKKMEYMRAKEQEKDAKINLDELAKTLNTLSGPIKERKKQKGIQESACKKVNDATAQNSNKRMGLLDRENQLGVKVRAKYDEMEELRMLEKSRQQRILKAKEDLAAAELELANLPSYEPPSDEMKRLENQIMELHDTARERRAHMADKETLLSQKKVTLRQCIDRLKGMENTNMKLLQALRNSGAEKIVEAYDWLQRHRNELKKEVYGPVLLEVNVSNRVHASYLEEQVPNYIWKSFITQDPADRDILVRGLKSFDVPVLNYVADRSHKNSSFTVSEEMRDLGIYSRLDQVFDAPAAVKEVLTSQAGLDRSVGFLLFFIGSTDTDQRADEVSKLGILDLWTPDNHYRWSVSRYGGHVSAIVEQVVPSRLFLSSVDAGEVERLRSRSKELEETIGSLEEKIKVLQTELRHLDDEAAQLHKLREDIVNKSIHEKKMRRNMESRVSQRKLKLESIEKEGDLESSTIKLTDQISTLNMQRFQNAIEIKNLLIEAVTFKWSIAEKHMTSVELDMKIREMELNLKQYEKTALQATQRFEHCKNETENCRRQLSDAKSRAESIAVITPQLEQEFLKMPSTIEDLEAAIQDNISQANSILFLNHNILEEYESRQHKIDAIAKKLETDTRELNQCLSEIDTLKGNWLPTLRNLVAKINETFSRNFEEMAVAGEVSLDEHDVDFDKFGILIKVKFRQAGQLQVLSAHHQSGGERSVSTILYLVSLQDLTNCPFRVVDEINQGMDPINERKMFQQLVRAASQPNTPQCFLLTPKLLPDLEYSDACSILNIMNGPWIEKPAKVWSSGDCWRQVMGLAGEG